MSDLWKNYFNLPSIDRFDVSIGKKISSFCPKNFFAFIDHKPEKIFAFLMQEIVS